MEELWKKHKEETRDHLQKINEFLKSELEKKPETQVSEVQQIQNNIVLDEIPQISDEFQMKTRPRGRPVSERRKIYGKLKEIVKDLMEKEGLSRAQAYRKAKKMILEKI